MSISQWVINVFLVFGVIILFQIPSCIVVFGDDTGQISYFEYPGIVDASKAIMRTLIFPLYDILLGKELNGKLNILFILYIGNIALYSLMIVGAKSMILRFRNNQMGESKGM